MLRQLLSTLVFLALLAAPARGATVHMTVSYSTGPHGSTDTYAAVVVEDTGDERNVLTFATEPVGFSNVAVIVHDAGGTPLTAGDGCAPAPPDAVRCGSLGGLPGSVAVDVRAGGGDDTIVAGPAPASFDVDGGDGADRLDAHAVTVLAALSGARARTPSPTRVAPTTAASRPPATRSPAGPATTCSAPRARAC
jgi:hypothetical protein